MRFDVPREVPGSCGPCGSCGRPPGTSWSPPQPSGRSEVESIDRTPAGPSWLAVAGRRPLAHAPARARGREGRDDPVLRSQGSLATPRRTPRAGVDPQTSVGKRRAPPRGRSAQVPRRETMQLRSIYGTPARPSRHARATLPVQLIVRAISPPRNTAGQNCPAPMAWTAPRPSAVTTSLSPANRRSLVCPLT
jgi:hypothetical protein